MLTSHIHLCQFPLARPDHRCHHIDGAAGPLSGCGPTGQQRTALFTRNMHLRRTPDASPPRLLRASVYPRAGTDARKPRCASMHRWGRPTQRKKTQPSTSNIGEADRRCTQFEYGQRGPHGPRESESRHPVTNPGLSDLSAQELGNRRGVGLIPGAPAIARQGPGAFGVPPLHPDLGHAHQAGVRDRPVDLS